MSKRRQPRPVGNGRWSGGKIIKGRRPRRQAIEIRRSSLKPPPPVIRCPDHAIEMARELLQ